MIWLLDRSRVSDGRDFCSRSRLLNYHIGPTGYGIAMKGTKLPLMTGIAGHEGLAPILQWCADHDDLILQGLQQLPLVESQEVYLPVPFQVVRDAVAGAQAKYWKAVEARGFAYLRDDESVKELTREQNYLIEGLIWAWCIEVLPEVLRRARILEVEHDDTYVFDCTCGLGDGVLSLADHNARGCNGLGLMCRPDFVADTRFTQELEYHEFKTTGMDHPTFRDKWEVQIQTFAAILDAERRLQRQVQSVWIHGLIKGKREGEYNPASGKRDGAPRQSSVSCYGYRKPAMPPMEQEEWMALYEYFDPIEQKNKRLPKAFQKTGIWELPDALIPAGESKGEFWAKWIPAEARRKQLVVLGPFSRQGQMVEHFLEECKGEERRWQEGLWQMYDLGQTILGEYKPILGQPQEPNWWEMVWPDPRFQRLLDRLFPRSYACRRYGLRSRCQFEDVCLEREGWADPVGSGKFVDRRPHHADELQEAIGRGLLLPEEGVAEEGEVEG